MDHEISCILQYLNAKKDYNFSGNRLPMIQRRLKLRQHITNQNDLASYFDFLQNDAAEVDLLIDSLTINVTKFFRNPFAFYYLEKIVFKDIIAACKNNNQEIRIWSAGCSTGEETYTLAILLQEYFEREKIELPAIIIGTDIDKNIIKKAKTAVYNSTSIENLPFSFVEKYFRKEDEKYVLIDKIKNMVDFSEYDILHHDFAVPPASVFGDFNLILCRNLLIYFYLDSQTLILNRIASALVKNGYLMLGEAEMLSHDLKSDFKQLDNCCKIFKKL